LLFVSDPMEAHLPNNGIFRFSNGDMEVSLNTRDNNTRHNYQQRFDTHRDNLYKLCRKLDMRFVDISTGSDIVKTLHNSLGLPKR
ncbi:MAG: hypothetical protein HYZ31_05315, partial [Gammaproteobacteria bacterium]|nr:hypothetical protein [Gammaproteobacteria bacterium]